MDYEMLIRQYLDEHIGELSIARRCEFVVLSLRFRLENNQ